MRDERHLPEWAQVLAGLLGLAFALPFAYVMLVEWFALVNLGGWFSSVMVAWALSWIGFLALHVIGPWLERRHYVKLGERLLGEDCGDS
jgi:hypothetical protein